MKATILILLTATMVSGCTTSGYSNRTPEIPTRISLKPPQVSDNLRLPQIVDRRPEQRRLSYRLPAAGGQLVSYGDDLISPPPLDFIARTLAKELTKLDPNAEVEVERFEVEVFLRDQSIGTTTTINPSALLFIPFILVRALPVEAMASTSVFSSRPTGGAAAPPNTLATEVVINIAGIRYQLRTVTNVDYTLTTEEMAAQIADNLVRLARSASLLR